METPPAIHRGPDRAEVIRLSDSAALPTSDLTDDHMQDFFMQARRARRSELSACSYSDLSR